MDDEQHREEAVRSAQEHGRVQMRMDFPDVSQPGKRRNQERQHDPEDPLGDHEE